MTKYFTQLIGDSESSLVGWMIFFISLLLFTLNTLNQSFGFGVEESRYILFAQQMLHTGITPFPLLRTQPYPDYPATYTIIIYLFSLFGNKVTAFTAILPSALASAWTLMLTYRIAVLHSVKWGLYAVLFALGTYEFLLLARLPSPDPLVAAIAITCFYLLYNDNYPDNKVRWIIPILLIGGFLIRGPLGLIIPALVSCSYYLCENNYKRFVITAGYSLLLLLICSLLLLWIAYRVGGTAFAQQVLFMQAAGRIVHLGVRPFYYYFVAGLGAFSLAFPVALIVVLTHVREWWGEGIKAPLNPDYRLLRHLMSWVLTILIVLSISKEKHFRYVIAIVPPLALLAGYIFISIKPSGLLRFTRRCLITGAMLLPFVGLFFVVALLVVNRFWLPLSAHYIWATLLLITFIVATLYFKQTWQRTLSRQQVMLFAIGIATWVTLFITIAEPIAKHQFTSIKPLVDRVSTIRTPEQQIVLYKMLLDREGLKFMALLDETAPPPFIMSPHELVNYKQPAVFIARVADYEELPQNIKDDLVILWRGKQARRSWVMFTKE